MPLINNHSSMGSTSLISVRKTPVIFVTSTKGGTGKTTTAANIAATLAKLKKKTLLIDIDAQEHISMLFGIEPNKYPNKNLVYGIKNKLNFDEIAIQSNQFDSLYLVLSGRKLGDDSFSYRRDLKPHELLNSLSFDEYDFVLFDTTSNMNDALYLSALHSSNYYIVPSILEKEPILRFIETIKNIETLKISKNLNIINLGLLLCKYDKKNQKDNLIIDKLKQSCREHNFPVCENIVPFSDKTSEGVILISEYPNSEISKSYTNLTKEILYKIENCDKSLQLPDVSKNDQELFLEVAIIKPSH